MHLETLDIEKKEKVLLRVRIFDFLVLWYYFMSSSMILRPLVSLFWPLITILGLYICNAMVLKINSNIKAFICVLCGCFISLIVTQNIDASSKYITSIALFLLLAYELVNVPGNLKVIVYMMYLFLLFFLFATYLQLFNRGAFSSLLEPFLPNMYTFSRNQLIDAGSLTGFTNQTSSNATMMSMGTILSCLLLLNSKKTKNKIFFGGMIGAFYIAVTLTNRRGATFIVLFLLLLTFYYFTRNPLARIGLILAVAVLVASGSVTSLPFLQNAIGKMQMMIFAGDISDGRFDIWKDAFEVIREHTFLGVGINAYEHNTHNIYIQTLIETGIIGSVLILFGYIYPFIKNIRRVVNSSNSYVKKVGWIMFLWGMFTLINGLFEAVFLSQYDVFIFFLSQLAIEKILDTENI